MRFAHGVLTARDKVQMMMASTRLGVYHEGDVATLPGVHLDEEDGAWLRLDRLRETKPPAPVDYVAEFMSSKGTDPEGLPEVLPAISKEVAIEEASDLVEAGLLRPENVHPIVERGIEVSNRVRVTLLAEDCPEMLRDFESLARRSLGGLGFDRASGAEFDPVLPVALSAPFRHSRRRKRAARTRLGHWHRALEDRE